MITPISPRFLKQKAKKLAKSKNIILAKAQDSIAMEYGFSNYRHYLKVYKANREQSKANLKILLETLSQEKELSKKINLALSFAKSARPPFRDLLEILKQFQYSEKAIQRICSHLNLMEKETQLFLFEDFLTGEGADEISFRAYGTEAKEISITDLVYQIDGEYLVIEGNYTIKANFNFELGVDDPKIDPELYKGFIYEGTFEVEIAQNKKIILRDSTMSMYDISTPMTGFTEEEIEEYYSKFPDERGRFDEILIMDDLDLI